MLLRAAVHISLFFYAASVAAVPSLKPNFDDKSLPSLRLPREQVDAIKRNQIYPPGYIHKHVKLGEGKNAITVPIVEVDPAILLDNEDGVRARANSLGFNCGIVINTNFCAVAYCWLDDSNTIRNTWLNFEPGKNFAKSNPTLVQSQNPQYLTLNTEYNTGYNNWFPKGHECSNSDTMIYTNHYLSDTVQGLVSISGFQCNNCHFSGLNCYNTFSNNRLVAYSSNDAVDALYC